MDGDRRSDPGDCSELIAILSARMRRSAAGGAAQPLSLQKVPPELQEEIIPKNIIMIGPTGSADRDCAPPGLAWLTPPCQGRGDQVYRGGYGPRRRIDDPRSGGDRIRIVQNERMRGLKIRRPCRDERLVELWPAAARRGAACQPFKLLFQSVPSERERDESVSKTASRNAWPRREEQRLIAERLRRAN